MSTTVDGCTMSAILHAYLHGMSSASSSSILVYVHTCYTEPQALHFSLSTQLLSFKSPLTRPLRAPNNTPHPLINPCSNRLHIYSSIDKTLPLRCTNAFTCVQYIYIYIQIYIYIYTHMFAHTHLPKGGTSFKAVRLRFSGNGHDTCMRLQMEVCFAACVSLTGEMRALVVPAREDNAYMIRTRNIL